MKTKILFCFMSATIFIFTACADHAKVNNDLEQKLTQKFCSDDFFTQEMSKVDKKDDAVYVGLNVGLIARNCGDFNLSNDFFDKVENLYQVDVDLRNGAEKILKTTATTLINDDMLDYDGSLYERIMVNVYKGLNFMSEGDHNNARVEFKRALLRQDRAKDYFKNQIAKNKADLEKAKKEDPNFTKNFNDSAKEINAQYVNLFEEFSTSEKFTNPYATYLASIFYFMNQDYTIAKDLFKEIRILNSKNNEINKEWKVINSAKKNKKYIFVVYENGFGVIKDEFKLTLPLILNDTITSASIALPTLKKRSQSFDHLSVNDVNTTKLVNLDDVVASEFKFEQPAIVTKAISSAILKTIVNAAVANNDSTGGILSLASGITTAMVTKADVRSWRGLPQSIGVVMVENNGNVVIQTPNKEVLFNQKVNLKKNVLIIVRSFAPNITPNINVIEK
ncbi:hypothetical protein [Campylobacter insulaenigrae]|uniref:hypothetical protein n=1 Tax=Campylobacter insulaenigrae TaxID=260714 RepID=UPI0021538E63|nr:hypothetical protein [Campylobacter insulaenigrae]MCR6571169.1 hypothetical protein [Campylobacter insulaenigrae]MCR6572897.1 hypothetical protein [Campylobacter insulaenigrae]MCR6574244.1 hypothetical protein [Campylobacter insulaenigrae]MCR6578968.1 hypothetical protein [Campylobacter insulaenigrae]MCR6580497.1 hypothetical protein [Campylobacter insulaenigrae]